MNRREFLYTAGLGASLLTMAGERAPAAFGESEAEREARLAWWREARFGLFIHWGLYAIPAGIWKGRQTKTYPAEWLMFAQQIPKAEYAQLAGQFNPVKFDARQWARMAKDAGMKYLVITSKHHDGFCMFDSKLTEYDIMDATPFKRDVLAELSRACAEEGIKFGLYYSQLDWSRSVYPYHLYYMPRFGEYIEYMKGQLRELLTNYGPLGSLFFDGDWMPQWNNARGREIEELCHELQPQVVINDRLSKRPLKNHLLFFAGVPHAVTQPEVGDYATPEQLIPDRLPECDWETCMTMNDSWGYKSFDHNWKSSTDLIRKLVDIASKGGNFLLNVGPTAEGLIPEPSVERLAQIGQWMKVNGESIYGTTAGPLQGLSWGRSTRKPGRVFLHVFDWPGNELVLQGWKENVTSMHLLADPEQRPLPFTRDADRLLIKVPEKSPDPAASVVVLNL